MTARIKKHGLSLGIERHANEFFLSLKVTGKLSHADYEIITPMLDSALKGIRKPVIKAIIDSTELEGWEARAAWDDLKLGLKHGRQFEKIAIVGNKKWQKAASKIGSWFIAGTVQNFENEELALQWLSSTD